MPYICRKGVPLTNVRAISSKTSSLRVVKDAEFYKFGHRNGQNNMQDHAFPIEFVRSMSVDVCTLCLFDGLLLIWNGKLRESDHVDQTTSYYLISLENATCYSTLVNCTYEGGFPFIVEYYPDSRTLSKIVFISSTPEDQTEWVSAIDAACSNAGKQSIKSKNVLLNWFHRSPPPLENNTKANLSRFVLPPAERSATFSNGFLTNPTMSQEPLQLPNNVGDCYEVLSECTTTSLLPVCAVKRLNDYYASLKTRLNSCQLGEGLLAKHMKGISKIEADLVAAESSLCDSFRASVTRVDVAWGYQPINLHVHRCHARRYDNCSSSTSVRSWITSGTYAATPLGLPVNGSASSLRNSLQDDHGICLTDDLWADSDHLIDVLSSTMDAEQTIDMFYLFSRRCDMLVSQLIGATTSAVIEWLSEHFETHVTVPPPTDVCLCVLSMLSCLIDEAVQMEDMMEGWRHIAPTLRFKLRRASATDNVESGVSLLSGDPLHYRQGWTVGITVPGKLFDRLPAQLQSAPFGIKIFVVNVGMNVEAVLSHCFRVDSHEQQINDAAVVAMSECLSKYSSRNNVDHLASLCSPERRYRNVEILVETDRLTRSMGGITMICCKSGKDRTAMLLTLLEGIFVRDLFGLSDEQTSTVVSRLRDDGTGIRLSNCRKNLRLPVTGYSFAREQLPFYPACMRPWPELTWYGGLAQT